MHPDQEKTEISATKEAPRKTPWGPPPGEGPQTTRRERPPKKLLPWGAPILAALALLFATAHFLAADPTEYATGLAKPGYVATHPDGTLYVGGALAPWMKRYVGPATLDSNWSDGQVTSVPNGIAVDGNGYVYVLNGSTQILKCNRSGDLAASPVPLPAAVSGQQPHGLGLDPNGSYYYVVTWGDHKVYRISPDASGGTATATDLAFPTPPSGTRSVNGLWVDPYAEVIYVTSAISGTSNFIHSAPLRAPSSSDMWTQVNVQPNGASVYYQNIVAHGTLFYVTDTTGNRVYRVAKTVNATPELLQTFGSFPGGLAIDDSGYLYAVERGSGANDGKIYRFAPGSATPTTAPTSPPASTVTPAATAAPTQAPTSTPGATSTPAPTAPPSATPYPSPAVTVPAPTVGVTGGVPVGSPSPLPTDAPPLTPGPPGATLRIAQDALTELFGFEDPQLQLVHGDGYRWIFDLQGSHTFTVQVKTTRTEEGGFLYVYTIFLRSGDGWVAFANGSSSGTRAPWKGALRSNAEVFQRFDVLDNGSFDCDPRRGYAEIQVMKALLAAPKATDTPTPTARGSSGGCSSGLAVPSLILLGVPFAFTTRRKR